METLVIEEGLDQYVATHDADQIFNCSRYTISVRDVRQSPDTPLSIFTVTLDSHSDHYLAGFSPSEIETIVSLRKLQIKLKGIAIKISVRTSPSNFIIENINIPWGRNLANRRNAINSLQRIKLKIADFLENGRRLVGQNTKYNTSIKRKFTEMLSILNEAEFINADELD